jgi:hypothetical protein
MWTLLSANLRFPSPKSTTTVELVCRVAKLCAKRAAVRLVSNPVKRIRTEEPDEGILHVRHCGNWLHNTHLRTLLKIKHFLF